MSGTNTETLTLYKNSKLYNGSRYKYYQTDRDYNAYLLEQDPEPYEKTVYFKSLSEPILLQGAIKNYDEYTYGKITNNDKEYYIFIDKITTDANERTTIEFSVDWWSTNWSNINCTKAHLTRKPTKPGYMPQPYTPMVPTFSKDVTNQYGGVLLFTYNDSLNNDLMKAGVLDFITKEGIAALESGSWESKLLIPPTDITGVYIVPLFSIEDFGDWEEYTKNGRSPEISWKTNNGKGYNLKEIIWDKSFNSKEEKVEGILDWKGNNIWQCPLFRSVNKFKLKLTISPSSCQIRFKPIYNDDDTGEYGEEIIGKGFTYACRKASVVIDPLQEYTWRERDSEIWMREIQSAKQVWEAATSAIEGAGYGYAFGEEKGLKSSLAGGIVGTISTAIMNSVFDPEIQKATDLRYQNQQDFISVIGDSLTELYDMVGEFKQIYYVPLTRVEFETFEVNNYVQRFHQTFPSESPTEGDIIYGAVYEGGNEELPASFHMLTRAFKYYTSEVGGEWVPYYDDSFIVTLIVSGYELSEDEIIERYRNIYGKDIEEGELITNHSKVASAFWNIRERTFLMTSSGILKQIVYFNDGSILEHRPITVNHSNFSIYDKTGYPDLIQKYTLDMDTATKSRMNKDIAVNGYTCDESTDDLQSLFAVSAKIQADNSIIEGNCCVEGKQQIVYRLKKGVEFI